MKMAFRRFVLCYFGGAYCGFCCVVIGLLVCCARWYGCFLNESAVVCFFTFFMRRLCSRPLFSFAFCIAAHNLLGRGALAAWRGGAFDGFGFGFSGLKEAGSLFGGILADIFPIPLRMSEKPRKFAVGKE